MFKSAAALFAALLLLAGCSTTPRPAPVETVPEVAPPSLEPAPAPVAEPVEKKPPPPPPPAVTVTPKVEPAPAEPAAHPGGKLKIRIESAPTGAMIVVNGMPVGRTPLDIEVDSANNGFFKDPVSIRARFVAGDTTVDSVSVDEELGPLERVPLALVFSREGVQRVIRRY